MSETIQHDVVVTTSHIHFSFMDKLRLLCGWTARVCTQVTTEQPRVDILGETRTQMWLEAPDVIRLRRSNSPGGYAEVRHE